MQNICREEVSLQEIKKIELSILQYIAHVCRENNINYSLSSGTLLGAVRHRGFIPWDDDIDIMLTRDNYTKLISILRKSTEYLLLDYESGYYNLFSKLCDMNTIVVENYAYKSNLIHGVFVDIFPVDYLSDTLDKSAKIFDLIRYKKYLLVASRWRKYKYIKEKSLYRNIVRLVFFILSRFENDKNILNKIQKIILNNRNEHHAFSGIICSTYEKKDIHPSELFEEYIQIEFEGSNFSAIKKYDSYLKKIYGNYLQLPPVEKRVTNHDFQVIKNKGKLND